jgi:opacity protein-like surface antigen
MIKKLFVIICLITIPHMFIMAQDCYKIPQRNDFYIGVFLGRMYPSASRVSQSGTSLKKEAQDGPLAVLAIGDLNGHGSFSGGLHLGYNLKHDFYLCQNYKITPSVEIEGYWYKSKKSGQLNNDAAPRLPNHEFYDTFPMYAGVYLANAVFSLNTCSCLSPYAAIGVGASRTSIYNAYSLQVDPAEPNLNHFNTDANESSWTFAFQAKLGLGFKLCDRLNMFAEYRYLFLDFNNYQFGSTKYTGHAVTTPWNVKFENSNYNAFILGIRFEL